MITRPNDGGGTTLVLAEGDDLDSVPESHVDILTDPIRRAFGAPTSYFGEVAKRTPITNLRGYLSNFVTDGRWTLLLADTYMMDRDTIGAFQWLHPDQHACMITPADAPCSDRRFSPIYDDIALLHWDSIAHSGGILPFHQHISLADYGAHSTNPAFPVDSTHVFGSSACGDMMIYDSEGNAGYLSHENGTSYATGTVSEMVDWVCGKLTKNQTPEFDYSRC